MNENKNLMGLNLSVDNDLIAQAVRESIVLSVAQSLDNKEELVGEFVKAILTERVRESDGSISRSTFDKTCTRMEYYLKKAIGETVKEEIINMIEEQKPSFKEIIKKEFAKKQTQSKLVEMFMAALSNTVENSYRSYIDIRFEKQEEY